MTAPSLNQSRTPPTPSAENINPPENPSSSLASGISLEIKSENPNNQHQQQSGESHSTDESHAEGTDSAGSEAPAGSGLTPPQNDDELITSLASMKPMEYDRVRLEHAKALGIQVKTLDDTVKAARKEDDGEAGRLPFPEVESFPDPIDPALLFSEIAAAIRRFIVLDSEQADAAALWVAHTYLTAVFDTSPIAIINAPEKACAKTLFQTVLARISYRQLSASNASASALFRSVELWNPTLFFDEADTFFRDKAELQGMVNAGYKRSGFVLRSEAKGDGFEPRMFSVYGAKSIAGIALEKHLPDSTMSRGIVFNLRRKLAHESVERLRHADSGLFEVIASKLVRFSLDYAQQVRLARPVLPDELSDRDQDNWEPLLAIAECAGPEWLQRAIEAALMISSANEVAVSTGNELLADIQQVFEMKCVEKISTVDLIEALVKDEENSWAAYNRGKPITPRQLARHLAVYGISSKTVRMGPRNTPKGFDAAQFEDAFARYLTPPTKTAHQSNDIDSETLETLTEPDCGGVVDKTWSAGYLPPGRKESDF